MTLLASGALGALYLLLLFGTCFGGVVGFRWYALRRREAHEEALREEWEREHPQPPPPPQPQPQPAQPQNVYYIVEKKRTRARGEYAAPREIRFQK